MSLWTPEAVPDAVAVESWYAKGMSVALAWLVEGQVVVRAFEADDVVSAVDLVKATGFRGSVAVGATVAKDPALLGVRRRAMKARVGSLVADLDRMIRDDVLRHDGGELLSGQTLTYNPWC